MQSKLVDALYTVLMPLAKLMIRIGVDYRVFAGILRDVYVMSAQEYLAEEGRKPSISEVSRVTGLTRPDVRSRLAALGKSDRGTPVSFDSRLAYVLAYWIGHAEFVDKSGKPRELPFAEEEHSFSCLVERSIGDCDAKEIARELEVAGSVKTTKTANGEIESVIFLQRSLQSLNNVPEYLKTFLGTFTRTVEENLAGAPGTGKPMRLAYSHRLDAEKQAVFRRIAEERIPSFIEQIDDVLQSCETRDDSGESGAGEGTRVGVGAFYFEQPMTDADGKPVATLKLD